MATSTTLTSSIRPFVAGRTPTKSEVAATKPTKLPVARTLPTKPPFASTSQAPRTSNAQHQTRLSCSQRYRLGLTKIINGQRAQPSPRQGLEAPENDHKNDLNTSSIQPQNRRLTSLKTSKKSEQIETNYRQNNEKSFSQRCTMNSYGFRNLQNAIPLKSLANARFDELNDVHDVRNTVQTASNHSTSSIEDINGKSATEPYLHTKLPSTMYETAIEASKVKNLIATGIKTVDLKENMKTTENSKKTVKSSQQNGAILQIQKRSFQEGTMKERRGCEYDRENNKDVFIQNQFENNSESFNSSNGVQREFLRSCREEEQSLFQEFSRGVDIHDSREFYNIEEYDDILDTEEHRSIINSAKYCTLGAIIEEHEEHEGIEYNNYFDSILNSGIDKVITSRDRREELSYRTDVGERSKNEIKWAKTIKNSEETGIAISMNTRSKFLETAKQNFPSKTVTGKLNKNDRMFSMPHKAHVTDDRNIENNPGFLKKDAKCLYLRPFGKQFLKVGEAEQLVNKNDHLNDDRNVRVQSAKSSDVNKTKTKSIQKHHVTGPFYESIGKIKNTNIGENLTSGFKKPISTKRKSIHTPIRIETATENFAKKNVGYRVSSVESKLFSNIYTHKQAKEDENTFAMEEVTNSLEDSDNISRSSSELSLTMGSGSLSSEHSEEKSNEFEKAAANVSAPNKNAETVMLEYHSLRDGPDSSEEKKGDQVIEKEDSNDLCSSASSDSLLDEFLSRSSRLRIASLQKKLRAQNTALDLLKKANQQLAEEKQERQRRLQESEANQRRTAAQLRQAKRAASVAEQRRATADEQAKLQLKKYQDLTTEMAGNRRSSASHNAVDPATVRRLQNSLAVAAADRQRLHLQVQALQREASSAAAEYQQQLSQLRLQVRQLQLLIQKQRQLIAVLQKQKISILAAKATECVERRLNSIVNDKK